VWNSQVGAGDIVVVDRNCHKSVLHAIILTGAIPIFLTPTRNLAGIIGPIPREQFTPESIRAKIEANPFIADKTRKPKILALTQSTYDGIIYNAEEITQTLDGHVDALHFDEAWLPHAGFHELYAGMHAIGKDRPRAKDTMVYATQSTHKLLAGLSQASQVLVRESESRKLDETVFNESYLMHTSTSPQYAIIASCDVSAAMMEGRGGHALVEEAITEAMEFRRAIIRIEEETGDDWWFGVWGPDTPAREGLAAREEWELTAAEPWHGFDEVDEGFTMLDPIKVTVLTPGLGVDGVFGETGIPAAIISRYLAEHGIVVEKTGLYSFFILFTIGITKGRWSTLISELQRFKEAYDENHPLSRAMPDFAAAQPQYASTGLRDLCQRIHEEYRRHDVATLSTEIYTSPVQATMTPTAAWNAMASGKVEQVPIDALEGRVTAVLLTPYPPGIPLLVPGERVNATIMRYLRFEEEFNARFPGFETLTHGMAEAADGPGRTVLCIVE
jgi:arginine decarboxylase